MILSKRALANVLLVLLLVSASVILGGCGDSEKSEPAADMSLDPRDKPNQTSHDAMMNFSSEGKMRAELRAGRIRVYEQKRYTELDSNVRVDFFAKNGDHSSYLSSKSAIINDANKNMTAYTAVHIVSDSGTVVDTDSLEWLNATQMMHSDADVKIVEKNGRVTKGRGFESDQNLDHYMILHPFILTPSGQFQIATDPNAAARPEPLAIPGQNAVSGSKELVPILQTPIQIPVSALDTVKRRPADTGAKQSPKH